MSLPIKTNFHFNIKIVLFEALYGIRCRTTVCWYEYGESIILGPEVVQQTTKKVKMIHEKIRTSHSR